MATKVISDIYLISEWMIEWMIYLMSKTWEVFTQSSEQEAHVKNARQTKKIQNKIKCELCIYKH